MSRIRPHAVSPPAKESLKHKMDLSSNDALSHNYLVTFSKTQFQVISAQIADPNSLFIEHPPLSAPFQPKNCFYFRTFLSLPLTLHPLS